MFIYWMKKGVAQVTWHFENAYPVALEQSEFNAGENNIAIRNDEIRL